MAGFDNDLGNAWDLAEGRSIPTLKFQFQDEYGNAQAAPIGTEYTLQTTEDLDVVHQRNFDTNELEYWDDGRPKKNIVVTGTLVSTNVAPEQYSAGDDDDLVRRFFFKGVSMRALQDEIKGKKLNRFGIGTKIKITLTGFRPPKNGRGYPTKLYGVEIIEPTPYVAPEQRQVENALGATQASPVHQQAQTNFPPAQAPAASAAPVQAAAQPVQDQPVAHPAAAAPAPHPAASVAQQIQQAPIPAAAPAQPASTAQPAAAAPAPGVDGPTVVGEYNLLLGAGVDHDLAVGSLAKKYNLDASAVEGFVAI